MFGLKVHMDIEPYDQAVKTWWFFIDDEKSEAYIMDNEPESGQIKFVDRHTTEKYAYIGSEGDADEHADKLQRRLQEQTGLHFEVRIEEAYYG